MRRCHQLMTLLLCLSGLAARLSPAAFAAWPEGGLKFAAGTQDQKIAGVAASVGNGAVFLWTDRSLGFADLWLQRVDGQGQLMWGSGVRVEPAAYEKLRPRLLATSDGGAYVAWCKDIGSAYELYLQRFTAQGQPAWASALLLGTTSPGFFPFLCSDGPAGGAIAAWTTNDSPPAIRSQRVSTLGAVQWGASGLLVDSNAGMMGLGGLVASGSAQALLFWESFDSHFVQKVSSGSVVWPLAKTVCASYSPRGPDTLLFGSDGQGGAVISFRDNATSGVRLQRVGSDGAEQWGAAGVVVLPALGTLIEMGPILALHPSGHTLLVWRELNPGLGGRVVFSQRINADGAKPWGAAATRIIYSPVGDPNPQPGCFSDDSTCVLWQDGRSGTVKPFLQQYGSLGQELLVSKGVPVSLTPTMTANDFASYPPLPTIAADIAGRGIACWNGFNGVDFDVWAMGLNWATSLSAATAPSSFLRSNETLKPVLILQLSATGSDRLLSLAVSNFGTALAGSDLSRLSLFRSDSQDFNPATAVFLADLTPLSPSSWATPPGFAPAACSHGQYLILAVSVSATPTPGRLCQFGLDPNQAVFASGSRLPSQRLVNPSFQILEYQEALQASLSLLADRPLLAAQSSAPLATLSLTNNRAEPMTLSRLRFFFRDAQGRPLDPSRILRQASLQEASASLAWGPDFLDFTFASPPVLAQLVSQSYTLLLDLADQPQADGVSVVVTQADSVFDASGIGLALGTGQPNGFPLSTPAVAIKRPALADTFSAYPSPFLPPQPCRVGFFLETQATVSLTVYTLDGRKVRSLLDHASLPASQYHQALWDGRNDAGLQVRSGAYLLRLDARLADGRKQVVKRKLSLVH
jgi:hypothetical protein